MTLQYAEEVEPGFPFSGEEIAREVICKALAYENFPYEAEVSLTLTGEEEIAGLNDSFRQIHASTDVLSFPMAEYSHPADFDGLASQKDCFHPDSGECLLGDIVICVPKVWEQSAGYGHSAKREYAFLIAHSMLHLMGYDHMEDADAALMEQKQEQILQDLAITRDREEN